MCETLDQQRIAVIRRYFEMVDRKDPALLELFADDVTFFFPKFGTAHGRAAIARFGTLIAADAASLTHDIVGLSFIVDGDRIAVEGRESGITADGRKWPDGEASEGRFASVFEFDGALIRRTSIYVDPDFVGDDRERLARYRRSIDKHGPTT